MGPTLWTRLVVVVALVAVGACSGGVGEASTLTASLSWSRAAQSRGVINVLLDNPGDRPVQARTLALDDPRFAPVPTTERLVTVRPGTAGLLVPVALGAARCTGVLGEPRVLVGDAAVPVDDEGRRVLDGIVEDACDRAAIDRSASVAFVEATPVSPVAVDVVLRLERRRGSRPVTVDAVGSNVIFAATADDLPATLDADDRALDVTVRFSAERCEPHALAESKKTFQVPVWLALDGGDPAFVELTITGDVRRALARALHDGCAG